MREHMREFERQLNQTMTVRQAAGAIGVAKEQAAKEERDKIVAFLTREQKRHAKEAEGAGARGHSGACDRLHEKASVLRTMIAYIERGDHLTGESA